MGRPHHRRLSAERPAAIVSGNDLKHALLALGCMVAGVAYAPVPPPCWLIGQHFEKLRHVLRTTPPGLAFASSGARHGKSIQAAVASDADLMPSAGALKARTTTAFADLLGTVVTPAVDAACRPPAQTPSSNFYSPVALPNFPRQSSMRSACGAPTNSEWCKPCRYCLKRRPCRSIGCRVQMFFYAGAALAQQTWDNLDEAEEKEIAERIVMTTGLGMTESEVLWLQRTFNSWRTPSPQLLAQAQPASRGCM
jgi:hypothetical protein